MKDPWSSRWTARRSVAVAAGLVLGALGLLAFGVGVSTGAPSTTPALATPLATSVQTPEGDWATVPMGHLDDPLNTFWQLLFRPSGTTLWSNKVEAATAMATNGGLVLASSGADPSRGLLVVGIRPSVKLGLTPIVATTDAGVSWSNGLLASNGQLDLRLAPRPDALALGAGGRALAIVERAKNGGDTVLESTGALSSWKPLVSEDVLRAKAAARGCMPDALTAVGYLGDTAVVGASCRNPGALGLFAEISGRWQGIGPRLGPSIIDGRSEVLALWTRGSGLTALIGTSRAHLAELRTFWTANGTTWEVSRPLRVSAAQHVVSYGPTSGNGVFVLLGTPGGSAQLEVINGPGSAWAHLPAPPARTATVAFSPDGAVDALAVNDTVLTVWSLSSSSGGWTRSQVLHVAIQFGSSNP